MAMTNAEKQKKWRERQKREISAIISLDFLDDFPRVPLQKRRGGRGRRKDLLIDIDWDKISDSMLIKAINKLFNELRKVPDSLYEDRSLRDESGYLYDDADCRIAVRNTEIALDELRRRLEFYSSIIAEGEQI